MFFILSFALPYCVVPFALMDLGYTYKYNVSEKFVFSIVIVQLFNDENKHGKMGSSWHCKPAPKFALCGDIGFRRHIILQCRVRGMFFFVNFLNVVWHQRKFNEDLILIINFILFNVSIKEVIKVIILDRIKGNANECP